MLRVFDCAGSVTGSPLSPQTVWPSAAAQGVGTHDLCYFEAQSHGLRVRCLRFAAAVADVHARLASGWWPTLAGRGSNPQGPIVRFPLGHHRFLLTQAWPDARAPIILNT